MNSRPGSFVRFRKTADGVRIPFEIRGNGPLLVYVRGWITHLELMAAEPGFARFFARIQTHRRVVRYDTRGNGLADRNPPGPFDLASVLLDLEAVMDTLPPEPVEMWGSTYGAPIALAYVAGHPGRVSRLVIDGGYARGVDIMPAERTSRFLDMLDMARANPDLVYSSLSYMTDPDPSTSHEARVARLKQSIRPDALIGLYRLAFTVDVSDLLASVDVPTLVLHRRGSRAVPARLGMALAADLPSARFVALEGTAHNLYEQDPNPGLDAVGHFLGIDGLPIPDSDDEPTETDSAGSITVMFTDMAGSTELTERLGDRDAQRVVHAHNRIVRQALVRHGGREVKHTGDGIMASFRSATGALAAAAAIQQAASAVREGGEAPDLALGIGLNAGEPISEDEDLFGAVVQVAARVCMMAQPGQILLTTVVRDLAWGKGFRFTDVGNMRLKGISEPTRVWALVTGPD